MTLVITELSDLGIVMAADSAITLRRLSDGKIIEADRQHWEKLLPIPSIHAAVSYWGTIGAVSRGRQFDLWLKDIIESHGYNDLDTFADHLTTALNRACGDKPLREGQDVGVHVAGYSQWPNGESHPVFYHVHNGHGQFNIDFISDEINKRVVSVVPKWESEPRKLFAKHRDFPIDSKSIEKNLAILRGNYFTRNGEYFLYSIVREEISQAIRLINLIPNVSIPRDPSDLNCRKAMLHFLLETIVRLYRLSNQSRIIGGTVSSIAIGPRGYLP